ncbi:hypothetical protein HW555_006774 [Spodoptera exigua]|uniref:Uncharacterized protein n=1 Tax=Spodoptera exigua TaxID=7107 RepID=A0A835L478_SPOEX|nr:hypothetical protein HW555_006774 [Spodoptera exigua]
MNKNITLPELDTKTVLNVVEDNFRKLGLGSEDTIHRHLRFLFRREANWKANMSNLDQTVNFDNDNEGLNILMKEDTETEEPERIMFRRLKTVMTYHSVRTLQFNSWRAVTARPPSLVGKLDLFGPLQEHFEQLRIFLNKITKICAFAKADDKLSFEGLRVMDPKMEALPEVALIDFLLQSPHILPLRETAALHRHVDDCKFYFEDVWPLPTQFTPRFLYKLKVDDSFVEPLPVMPWEVVKKEIKEVQHTIKWNEEREAEIKEIFFRILEQKIRNIVSSDMTLQIFNYVEFAYEQLIAPNETKFASLDMALALEREYDNLTLNISAYDLSMIKQIEKETYEHGHVEIKRAKEAFKLLKDVDKLSKRLKSSYEPTRRKIYE